MNPRKTTYKPGSRFFLSRFFEIFKSRFFPSGERFGLWLSEHRKHKRSAQHPRGCVSCLSAYTRCACRSGDTFLQHPSRRHASLPTYKPFREGRKPRENKVDMEGHVTIESPPPCLAAAEMQPECESDTEYETQNKNACSDLETGTDLPSLLRASRLLQ